MPGMRSSAKRIRPMRRRPSSTGIVVLTEGAQLEQIGAGHLENANCRGRGEALQRRVAEGRLEGLEADYSPRPLRGVFSRPTRSNAKVPGTVRSPQNASNYAVLPAAPALARNFRLEAGCQSYNGGNGNISRYLLPPSGRSWTSKLRFELRPFLHRTLARFVADRLVNCHIASQGLSSGR